MKTSSLLRWTIATTLLCLPLGALAQNLQDKIQHGRAQLQSIHSSVSVLQAHLAQKQKTQAQLRGEIAHLDQEITSTTAKLQHIHTEQQNTQTQIHALQTRIDQLQNLSAQQQGILADQLRAAYMLGGVTPLAVWLQTEKPAEIGRLSVYYQALARARTALIQRTENTAQQIRQTQQQLQGQERHLGLLAKQVSTQEQTLEGQRNQHTQLELDLTDRIAKDKAKISELQANAQILDGLVRRLTHEYQQQLAAARAAAAAAEARRKAAEAAAARAAAQRQEAAKLAAERRAAEARRQEAAAKRQEAAAEAAERQRAAELQAQLHPSVPAPRTTPVPPPSVTPSPPVNVVPRGSFPPPVNAPVSHAFGTPRVQGGPDWQGVTFSASPGTVVYAIAPGMVLYSGPLHGYQQIVIVEQKGKILAIYGHLGATQAQVGQQVQTGTALGTVGSGGEMAGDGMYLEIRNQGHPVNPMNYLR